MLSAIGAIIYGRIGYDRSKNKKFLKWVYVGGFCLFVVALNIITVDVLALTPPVSSIFHWIRLVCDVAVAILGLALVVD
jgi:hypothetical protein